MNKEFFMRRMAELEKRIHCLEKENQYLKNLLAGAGISYSEKEIYSDGNEYDPDQGSRIIPRDITETDAKVFFNRKQDKMSGLPETGI